MTCVLSNSLSQRKTIRHYLCVRFKKHFYKNKTKKTYRHMCIQEQNEGQHHYCRREPGCATSPVRSQQEQIAVLRYRVAGCLLNVLGQVVCNARTIQWIPRAEVCIALVISRLGQTQVKLGLLQIMNWVWDVAQLVESMIRIYKTLD